jgi:UPF0755 protein
MSQPSDQLGVPVGEQRVSLFARRAKAPSPAPPPPPAPAPEPPRKRRRSGLSRLSGLLSFALIAAIIAMGGYAWMMFEARRPGPLEADKIVQLVREDDGGALADQLERAGVIDSALWFTLITFVDGSHSALKRGEYQFKQHASLTDVEHILVKGIPVQHPLTIPEGLTSEQIVQRVRDAEFLAGDVKEIPHEGSLLPETYDFPRGFSRQAALNLMAKDRTKLVDEIWQKRAPDLPIKSPGELVTLASMVEKETGKADERARVAGVFVNRLQKRMKLQSDPTIVYGLVFGKGTLGHSISKAELDQATPYNTYIIEGLPPGPIANPGKAALEAAANPTRSKELYFVADGTGGHAFAETLDQHQKNVLRWRQIEKDAKDKLAPDAAPAIPGAPNAPGQTHGAIEPVDPKVFGALSAAPSPIASDHGLEVRLARFAAASHGANRAPVAPQIYGVLAAAPPATSGSSLAARLAKLGAQRQAVVAMLGPEGALSSATRSGSTLENIGAIVEGVNNKPADDLMALGEDPGPSGAPVATWPLSPAALADQQARAARYAASPGMSAPVSDEPAPLIAQATTAVAAIDQRAARPRAFDASEGTALDPLLNKTYDLSYAKVVPNLK